MAVRQLSSGDVDGTCMGQSSTDLIGFYGATPVVRRSGTTQAAITDSSGGTAGAAVNTITGTYNQTIIANNFATILHRLNEVRATLVGNGMWAGS